MRASRLLHLLLLLQTRGRMTAQELAEELEVSVRTVYRDVESLGAAGVPLYADRGPTGGYQLLDGYRTRLTGLTPDEADSLFLAGMPGPAAELGLGAVMTAAQLKLLAALPPELADRAGRVRERFHLDTPGWFREADHTPYLTAVAGAVWAQTRLRVIYRRWGPEDVERVLEPLGLVLKGGFWYLVAKPADRPPRTYRVSRIVALDALPGRFARPDGFDLATFWREWAARYERRIFQEQAVVRMSRRAREDLPDLLGVPVARAALATAGRPDPEGWAVLTVPIESIAHAHTALLKLGAEVEVLEPTALRELVERTIADLARLYHRRHRPPEPRDPLPTAVLATR
jgi:predicted DNA-binding transcriptional regulator YafY